MKIFTPLLFCILISANCYAELNTIQKKWIKESLKLLVNDKNIKTEKLILKKDVDGKLGGFLKSNRKILINDNEWIIVVSHSFHDDEFTNSKIGDITIIKTSSEKYYVNLGHTCKEFIIESKDEITDIESFLKSNGVGDKISIKTNWKEYKL